MKIKIIKEKIVKVTTTLKKELLELSKLSEEEKIQAVLIGDFLYLQGKPLGISRIKKSFCNSFRS